MQKNAAEKGPIIKKLASLGLGLGSALGLVLGLPFENRPFCQGYSLCKIVTLGKKLKLKKKLRKTILQLH